MQPRESGGDAKDERKCREEKKKSTLLSKIIKFSAEELRRKEES